jgi:hypothetical protein
VCRTLDILRCVICMASMDLLGIWMESGSGLYSFEYFIYAYGTYDRLYYDVVDGLLTMLF